jgi:beta-glucanase (GH16 family)
MSKDSRNRSTRPPNGGNSAMRPAFVLVLTALVANADPPASADWIPIPELSDEFNGESLDASKWHDHNPTWQGRQPGFFAKSNVSVSGGKLHLRAKAEDLPDLPDGYHSFTTAAVQSKALVKYGYFEIKCRPMKSEASSAFWFYRSTEAEWTEIDVFEIRGLGGEWQSKYHMNAHVFRSPDIKEHIQFPEVWKAPFVLTASDHVYALEWNEDIIRWFVDGEVVRELKNRHWHQALTLNFDSETMPDWFGLPDKSSLPAVFSIDYVRSWRRKP